MAKYRISRVAKEDLIRIHQDGVHKFGMEQADKYFDTFFEYFEIIAHRPFSFEAADFMKKDYRRCVCRSDTVYYKITNNTAAIMDTVGRQDLNSIL
jgi:toxin ParE1/3/4